MIIERIFQRFNQKTGYPPGTLIQTGRKKTEEVRVSAICYSPEICEEIVLSPQLELPESCSQAAAVWFDISGVHDTGLIEQIGRKFNFHLLVLEDIVNTGHRPKFDDMDDYLFVILKFLTYDDEFEQVQSRHIALILSEGKVFSFHEDGLDLFKAVRERLLSNNSRLRQKGADYLFYALIDLIVDNYFLVLEKIGDRLESLEEMVLADKRGDKLREIYLIRHEVTVIRKAIWPLRDVLDSFRKNDSPLIKANTNIYLRDLNDHIIRSVDLVEIFREMLTGLHDIELSINSNKMNEIMKLLTLISTIFIPMTFIAGVYGMNFKYMPELDWHTGYFLALGLMLVIGGGMGIYFKTKRWF